MSDTTVPEVEEVIPVTSPQHHEDVEAAASESAPVEEAPRVAFEKEPEASTSAEYPPGTIVIESSRRKNIGNVMLVGQMYRALPVKALVAIGMGKELQEADGDFDKLLASIEKFLASIFGRKVAPEIIARMKSAQDDLDLLDVMELIKALTKRATGTPTS